MRQGAIMWQKWQVAAHLLHSNTHPKRAQFTKASSEWQVTKWLICVVVALCYYYCYYFCCMYFSFTVFFFLLFVMRLRASDNSCAQGSQLSNAQADKPVALRCTTRMRVVNNKLWQVVVVIVLCRCMAIATNG